MSGTVPPWEIELLASMPIAEQASETHETRVRRYTKALDAISNPALRDRLARAVIAVADEELTTLVRQLTDGTLLARAEAAEAKLAASGESFEITEDTSDTPQPIGHTEQATAGYPKRDVKFTTAVVNISGA